MNFFLLSSLFFWLESLSFYTHMKMMRPPTGTDAPCSRRPSCSELLGGAVPWCVRVNSFTRTRLVQQCQKVPDIDQIRRHMPFFPALKSLPAGDVFLSFTTKTWHWIVQDIHFWLWASAPWWKPSQSTQHQCSEIHVGIELHHPC